MPSLKDATYGRKIVYHVAWIYVYRTRVSLLLGAPKVRKVTSPNRLTTAEPVVQRFKKEFVCIAKPLYFKEKRDAGPYCKQIAFANRDAGPYDWSFAVEWHGTETKKAKEDAHGPNNGHSCPRCGAMTLQGGLKDLCEGCSFS